MTMASTIMAYRQPRCPCVTLPQPHSFSFRRSLPLSLSPRRLTVARLFGGTGKSEDAARKALEHALSDNKDVFSKWDKELKKQEGAGGPGGGGNKWLRWFGGGDSWENYKQALFAVSGLAFLFLVLSKGMSVVTITLNSIVQFLRGFRNALESVSSGRFKRHPSSTHSDTRNSRSSSAMANVVGKWGSD